MGEALAALLASFGDLLQSVFGRTPRKNVHSYSDDEHVILVAVAERSQQRIGEQGNRVFVWGSKTGGYGLLSAGTAAPAEPIRFRRLEDESDSRAFNLLVDETLDLPALQIAYRGWPSPRIDVQPRLD